MVEIIEKLSEPVKLPVSEDLFPGDIVSLFYDKDNVICILSNSLSPFGIMADRRDKWGLAPIICGFAIVKTDNYDMSETYQAGDLLYSNEIGILTKTKCQENSLLLGHVLEPPFRNGDPIEINLI